MRHPNHLLCLIASALTSLLSPIPAAYAESKPVPLAAAEQPAALPAVTYYDTDGNARQLDPSGYKLTILHFWATWCAPCLKELPELDKVAAKYARAGLQVVPIALDGAKPGRIREFYDKYGVKELAEFSDRGSKAMQAVKGKGLPTSIMIDPKGNIIARADGKVDWSDKATVKLLETRLGSGKN